MAYKALLAIMGGLVSAFFSLPFSSGSSTGLMFVYFTSLPLFLVGFSLGLKSVIRAAGAGLLATGIFGGWLATGIFGLVHFAPSWLITKFIVISPQKSADGNSKKPELLLGSALATLAVAGASILVLLGFLRSEESRYNL